MNSVKLLGRLTRDPEKKVTGNGTSVTRFSIAVERDYKNADGKRDVDFINCTAWRETGDRIAQYFKKGKPIIVDGRWQVNSVIDEDSNQKKQYHECVVEKFHFVPGEKKNDDEDSGSSRSDDDDEDDARPAGGFRRRK